MNIVYEPICNNWSQQAQPERYAGCEAWVMWAESGTQLCIWEKKTKRVTVYMFTCKGFDVEKVLQYIKDWFTCTDYEYKILNFSFISY